MKKTILPENLNNFVALLDKFWGEYSFEKTEFIIGVNRETINKINNDLYHNTNHDGTPEETDEIIINLNGYKFVYRLEE